MPLHIFETVIVLLLLGAALAALARRIGAPYPALLALAGAGLALVPWTPVVMLDRRVTRPTAGSVGMSRLG